MLRSLAATLLCLLATGVFAAAPAPTATSKVMIVGTFHFENPGLDQHNVDAVDVLSPQRQKELAALTDALARFDPTFVAVEWPADVVTQRYSAYRAGTLDPSRNEVVQLGFRLAERQKLAAVHGIDVGGDFPYEALQQFADDNDQRDRLDAAQAHIGAIVQQWSTLQRERSLGAVLHHINTPAVIRSVNGFYTDALRYGRGDEQPGVALNVAWAARNYGICARLLQAITPGERAVVFYGHGHAHALRQCVADTPGVELIEATQYLPEK